MSTPFEFFRRNQKVALAAVTGMAILSFVVADAANNQGEMSGPAVAVLFIGCLAIAGWIMGVKDGKSRENAIFGAVLGLAVSLLLMFFGKHAASIPAKSGSISQQALGNLSRQRMLANRMVQLVFQNANPTNAGQRGPSLFGYLSDDDSERVATQLLLREADTFGIQVDREAAMNYLKEVAGQDENGETRLTRSVYDESLKETLAAGERVSEATVLQSIQEELRARAAFLALRSSDRLTPQDYWDLHRKMAIRQSSHFVSIPVEEFFDKSEPSEGDLKELFAAHRTNYPNFNAKKEFEAGLPGFALQRRIQLAYLEPDYEALEKQVPAITDEEVLTRYEESYKRAVPARSEGMLPQLPPLPNVSDKTGEAEPPAGEAPAAPTEPAAPAEPPASEPQAPAEGTPAPEATPAEPKPETPAEAKPAPEAKPEAPATEAPTPEAPAPTEAKPEAKSEDKPQSSIRSRRLKWQPVALIADEPAPATEAAPAAVVPVAPAPATEQPAAPEVPATEKPTEPDPEAPASDKPAAPAAEPPATDPPAEPAKPETPAADGAAPPAPTDSTPLSVPATDAEGDPAPPVAAVRPLDEELKQQIRDELLREKTEPLKREKIAAARDKMAELGDRVQEYLDHQKAEDKAESPLTEQSLSPEAATKLLKEYAAENGFVYSETPLQTYGELIQSEDHAIGMALVGSQMNRESSTKVVDAAFRSSSDLFLTSSANSFISGSHFAYWKMDDVKEHEPKTIDEPGVREMVIKAWRMTKARPLAEKRAKELADLIRQSDKPMEETLADQTVNGQPATLFVTVKATGDYQWVTTGGGFSMPRPGDILGIDPQKIDDPFRAKLFDDMQPGDVDSLPNADRSVFYVMKIDSRSHMTEPEMDQLHKEFVGSSNFLQSYLLQMVLTQEEQAVQFQQFVQRLEERHGVDLSPRNRDGG